MSRKSTAEKAAKPGRKPLPAGQAKDDQFHMRVNPEDKVLWREAAQVAGVPLSEWVTSLCNKAAR